MTERNATSLDAVRELNASDEVYRITIRIDARAAGEEAAAEWAHDLLDSLTDPLIVDSYVQSVL